MKYLIKNQVVNADHIVTYSIIQKMNPSMRNHPLTF